MLCFIYSAVKQLRGEHRLWVFENSMLRISGLKTDQIIGQGYIRVSLHSNVPKHNKTK
jgi:hypothetical protein